MQLHDVEFWNFERVTSCTRRCFCWSGTRQAAGRRHLTALSQGSDVGGEDLVAGTWLEAIAVQANVEEKGGAVISTIRF